MMRSPTNIKSVEPRFKFFKWSLTLFWAIFKYVKDIYKQNSPVADVNALMLEVLLGGIGLEWPSSETDVSSPPSEAPPYTEVLKQNDSNKICVKDNGASPHFSLLKKWIFLSSDQVWSCITRPIGKIDYHCLNYSHSHTWFRLRASRLRLEIQGWLSWPPRLMLDTDIRQEQRIQVPRRRILPRIKLVKKFKTENSEDELFQREPTMICNEKCN